MILTFPYRRAQGTDPSPVTPDIPVYRPIIPILLRGPRGNEALTFALLDTGADETILPRYLVKTLQVKLESKLHYLTAANGKAFAVQYGIVEISIARPEVGTFTWKSKVGFQNVRTDSVVGRASCLDLLDVRYHGPNRQVIITTP